VPCARAEGSAVINSSAIQGRCLREPHGLASDGVGELRVLAATKIFCQAWIRLAAVSNLAADAAGFECCTRWRREIMNAPIIV